MSSPPDTTNLKEANEPDSRPSKVPRDGPCGNSEAECDLAITQDVDGDYCVSLDGEEFPACLIPDIIEFLKIAQEWIDANKDNA